MVISTTTSYTGRIYAVYGQMLAEYLNPAITTTTIPNTLSTTGTANCTLMSQVKEALFGKLTLTDNIKAIIYNRFYLEFNNATISHATEIVNHRNATFLEPLVLCGNGSIFNNQNQDIELIAPQSIFCIYDDLGLLKHTNDTTNVFSCP